MCIYYCNILKTVTVFFLAWPVFRLDRISTV